ncbi:MAG: hypothetical protein EXR92_03730 [Gemmatimonadetes bacterium]|nr:hypothetical protein [Gemmatimonadota bacterium]
MNCRTFRATGRLRPLCAARARAPASLARAPASLIWVAASLICASASLSGQTPPPAAASATLRPGDVIGVEIWQEEDLSGEFIVDEAGIVTLPLLGRVPVTGIPIRDLPMTLIEAYHVELRNPSIVITPLRRIYVLGYVNEPGLLAVDPTVTLAGAVALAGGPSAEGDPLKLRVMRDGRTLFTKVGPDQDLLSIDIRSGDQIFVDRRGWFDRNSSFMVSATVGLAGIIVTLLRR